jgi:hypothetical protein
MQAGTVFHVLSYKTAPTKWKGQDPNRKQEHTKRLPQTGRATLHISKLSPLNTLTDFFQLYEIILAMYALFF